MSKQEVRVYAPASAGSTVGSMWGDVVFDDAGFGTVTIEDDADMELLGSLGWLDKAPRFTAKEETLVVEKADLDAMPAEAFVHESSESTVFMHEEETTPGKIETKATPKKSSRSTKKRKK